MNKDLVELATQERDRGLKKWGHIDKSPPDLMIAITEEIGEVAHAINHGAGYGEEDEMVKQEIAEVVGLLDRLWDMYCEE